MRWLEIAVQDDVGQLVVEPLQHARLQLLRRLASPSISFMQISGRLAQPRRAERRRQGCRNGKPPLLAAAHDQRHQPARAACGRT